MRGCTKLLSFIVLGILSCTSVVGCGRMLRGSSSSNTKQAQSSAKATGDPLVIVVIDTTQSVISRWSLIREATSAFLAQAFKQRDFDLAVIKLNRFPKEARRYKSSAFTEEQWTELEKDFQPGPEGEGTDQIGAMEEAVRAARGSGAETPSAVVLLYFSDMLIDQPKGEPHSFRSWDSFDWRQLKDAGITQAHFYVIHMANPEATGESRAVYRQQQELTDRLSKAASAAGLNAQWVSDSVLEDEVKKGRFTGPEFE